MAWRNNIEEFKIGIDSRSYAKRLHDTEIKLSKLIFSPSTTTDTLLCNAVANWADMCAEFPLSKKDEWKSIIRKCYNMGAMFSTSKDELKALKEYCEENIEAGSIHFHTLMKTLRVGIANHDNFLGLGSLDSPTKHPGYILLDEDIDLDGIKRGEETLLSVIASAPTEEPQQCDYPTKLAYLKARLAYQASMRMIERDATIAMLNNSVENI